MNIRITIQALLLVFLAACQAPRLTTIEKKLISSGHPESAMYVLNVFKSADSVFLRKVAQPVGRPQNRHIRLLAQRMYATVQHPDSKGVGIAAPQVGVSRNMIWVQRFDKAGEPFEVYFNPVILNQSTVTVTSNEGCLSIPECRGPVERPNEIQVKYANAKGKQVTETVEGFTARIFQHEIDHLNGVLYTDRIKEDSLLRSN